MVLENRDPLITKLPSFFTFKELTFSGGDKQYVRKQISLNRLHLIVVKEIKMADGDKSKGVGKYIRQSGQDGTL